MAKEEMTLERVRSEMLSFERMLEKDKITEGRIDTMNSILERFRNAGVNVEDLQTRVMEVTPSILEADADTAVGKIEALFEDGRNIIWDHSIDLANNKIRRAEEAGADVVTLQARVAEIIRKKPKQNYRPWNY